MSSPTTCLVVAIATCALARFTVSAADREDRAPRKTILSNKARADFIRRAQVWTPTDVGRMNLRQGPPGPGAFQPNEVVTCDYVERKMPGNTPKFYCEVHANDVVKVRYGETNREVEGSVVATRLLWALGFAADRVYPVQVRCRGCSADPWTKRSGVDGVHEFYPAVIERPPPGHEMRDSKKKEGWKWPELDDVDEQAGGAPREQRDALKLLAVFMQHSDTKPQQQRLLCLPGALGDDGVCRKPMMMLHDVGVTFGKANFLNRSTPGSVDLEQWAKTPIWRSEKKCIGHLSKSNSGTLEDPHISEAGRSFLAGLLMKLSDRQIRDLFEVARLADAPEWVAIFKAKREEIVTKHCPE